MQVEADSILQTISFLGGTSTYNGEKLLDGWDPSTMGKVTVDDGNGQSTGYSLADLASGGQLNFFSGDMNVAQRVVETASDSIAVSRGSIGTQMRSNESTMRALAAQQEGTEGARSLLEDADFAAEVARLVRAQTLRQAAIFATAVSTNQSGTVLKLLGQAGIDVSA
jgi:flagellin